MKWLTLHAGPRARETLERDGIRPDRFAAMAGASGGPKWFVLYGLDLYIFGEFLRGRVQPFSTIGSSAGAWRMACLALADPAAAIQRLALAYSGETYSDRPTPREITDKARAMLAEMLGPEGARQVATNPVVRTHTLVSRARHLAASRRPALQSAGLLLAGAGNLVSRRSLTGFFERVVFHAGVPTPAFVGATDLPSAAIPLTAANTAAALLASGSIPLILEGERDIPGAGPGCFLDGGITDYHLDLPFPELDGLVLYPHFSPRMAPGWFDKHLPWRRVRTRNLDNVLLALPSPAFVASLPGGRIPDRSDFQRLDPATRIRQWRQVLDASRRLGDEFATAVARGPEIARHLQPLPPLSGRSH